MGLQVGVEFRAKGGCRRGWGYGLSGERRDYFICPLLSLRTFLDWRGDPEKPNPDAACPSSSAPTRRTCPAIGGCSRCSSEIVERSFLGTASYNGEVSIRSCRSTDNELRSHTCFFNAFGLLSIQTINHPFSVSSTSATPDLPRCFTNSVNVTHHVEFMCKWFLS